MNPTDPMTTLEQGHAEQGAALKRMNDSMARAEAVLHLLSQQALESARLWGVLEGLDMARALREGGAA